MIKCIHSLYASFSAEAKTQHSFFLLWHKDDNTAKKVAIALLYCTILVPSRIISKAPIICGLGIPIHIGLSAYIWPDLYFAGFCACWYFYVVCNNWLASHFYYSDPVWFASINSFFYGEANLRIWFGNPWGMITNSFKVSLGFAGSVTVGVVAIQGAKYGISVSDSHIAAGAMRSTAKIARELQADNGMDSQEAMKIALQNARECSTGAYARTLGNACKEAGYYLKDLVTTSDVPRVPPVPPVA